MSPELDPRILAKLQDFARRRRHLIIVRGALLAVAMLLATMLLVAAIDYVFILSDEVRWILSGAAYVAVLIAEWGTCVRLLSRQPSAKRLARLFEHAEPKLREDLLSAVELGTTEGDRMLDSVQFRQLLQADVATRVEHLRMERILPLFLLKRYLVVMAVIVAAMVGLFFATGFQLGTLMLRAIVPGANLARVSKTKVEILEPHPAECVVPYGDAVPLLIQLSGAAAREAWLETFDEKNGYQRVKLVAAGKNRFSGAIQVGREDLQYRLRAGDALTRKFRLTAQARPYVVQFTKTFHPPAYTRQPAREVTEDGGDLIALEGTTVDLVLTTNQPMQSAEIRMDQGKTSSSLPLSPGQDGRLRASVELSASGSYRVYLKAARTGFENRFSPEYEISAEPDLVPNVEFIQPKADMMVPANDLVDLVGEASDDQALARVEQHFRINEGPWTTFELAHSPGPTARVTRRIDLYAQRVKPGDLVATRLVAIDLKGNRGESRTLQINVTAAGMEMKRLESLAAHLALFEQIKLWRKAIEGLARSTSESRQRFEQSGDSDPGRLTAVGAVSAAQDDFGKQHAATVAALATALRASQPGHQGADLVVLGRQLARVESNSLRNLKGLLSVVSAKPTAPYARDLMREADDWANRAQQRARVIDDGFRGLLNSEEADLLAENTQIIRAEQERLATLAKDSGDDAARWQALSNRVRVILAETKGLEDMLGHLAERNLGGDQPSRLARDLNKQRETVERNIAEKGATRELYKPIAGLAEAVGKIEKGALSLRAEAEKRPMQIVREFRQENQPTYTVFGRLMNDLDKLNGNKVLPVERRLELQAGRWDTCRDMLKTHGDLEEIRPTSDVAFVADLRAATAALEAIRALDLGTSLKPVKERVGALEQNFQTIEIVHDLQELYDGLNALIAEERWQIVTPRARTGAPRDWAWIDQRLNESPNDLNRLDTRDPQIRELRSQAITIMSAILGDSARREVDHEMNERRKPDHEPETQVENANLIAEEVRRALDLLKPHADVARAELSRTAPKLNEVAQALKQAAEALQKRSVEEKEKAETTEEAERIADAQQQLNQRLRALEDQLRADANKQDVTDANQRERARDADDAIAMLQDPPTKAAEALKAAAEAEAQPDRRQALAQAAEQQRRLAESLEQISKHYEAMEAGREIHDSRTAMRAKEMELGVKDELDQQYAKAERMAALAKSTPQQMLQQLERALPINPLMQQELSGITRQAVLEARRKLEAASQDEARVNQTIANMAQKEYAQEQAQNATRPPEDPLKPTNPAAAQTGPNNEQSPERKQLAQSAEQQGPIAATAGEAGQDLSRAGRHEKRLKNEAAGQQLQDVGKAIAKTAAEKVPAAQQALAQAQKAGDAIGPVGEANQELAAQAAQVARMTRGEQAQPTPDLPGQPKQMNAQQMQQAEQMTPAKSSDQKAPYSPASSAQASPDGSTPQGSESGSPSALERPASPGEQMWMARTLDALDAALSNPKNADAQNATNRQQQSGTPNGPPQQNPQNGQSQSAKPQNAQNSQQQGQPGQSPQPAGAQSGQEPSMAQAQQAMQQAQQAAQRAMQQARSGDVAPAPQGMTVQGDLQANSEQGAQAQGDSKGYRSLPEARNLKASDWGKLPKQMAEQLSRGQTEAVPSEYRGQVETYYRVIAERARKP